MGIVFSRSKKKAILVAAISEQEKALVPDGIQISKQKADAEPEPEPEPHPDTPIPSVQEQETEPNTQQKRLEPVDEWQESDAIKESETELKDEIGDNKEQIVADEEKEKENVETDDIKEVVKAEEEKKIEKEEIKEGNEKEKEEIELSKEEKDDIEPNEEEKKEIATNEKGKEEIAANAEEKEEADEEKKEETEEIKANEDEIDANSEEKKESGEIETDKEPEEESGEKEEDEEANKTEEEKDKRIEKDKDEENKEIEEEKENEKKEEKKEKDKEAEMNEDETETTKIEIMTEETTASKQLQQNNINASEENAPLLRLTPITAKTVPKNYSSTLGTIWHWGTNTDDLIWDVNFTKTGNVEISVDLLDIQTENPFSFTTAVADDQLECACDVDSNYHTFPLETGQEEKVTRVTVGVTNIIEPGAKSVVARVSEMSGEYVGNLRLIDLKGAGVESAVIQSRKANTVSATWDIQECDIFYSAIEISDSSPGTFFGVCCFRLLQLGLYDCQGHRSVWFQINQGTDDQQEQSLEIIEVGEDVKITDRRIEAAKTIDGVFQFPWSFDTPYHVMVKMEEIDNSYQYSVYFYKENDRVWKRVVVFKTAPGESEAVFESLIEDRRMGSITAVRTAKFGPCWYRKENEWHQVETVIPHLVGHVVNTSLNLDEDKICLSIEANPANQKDVYASKKLSVGNSVPSILESLPE